MLEEYARKRKFSRTPEPAPGDAGPSPADVRPFFCVQRHDASRLHYDFRLEVDGVLKSWAVPKGPSLDPGVRHLAVRVEDHPLEYGSFEGNIPAGEYGGGSVMLWDRGSYELLDAEVSAGEQLARGDFKFRLSGEKLRGDFALVQMKGRGKGNEWLLIKKRDQFATPGWDVEDYAWSVLSGRSQEEIAQSLPAHQSDAPPPKSPTPEKDRCVIRSETKERGKRKQSATKKKQFRSLDLEGRTRRAAARLVRAHERHARRATARGRRTGSSKSSGTACAPSVFWMGLRRGLRMKTSSASTPAAAAAPSASIRS